MGLQEVMSPKTYNKINLFWLGIGLLGAGCFALGVMTGLIF